MVVVMMLSRFFVALVIVTVIDLRDAVVVAGKVVIVLGRGGGLVVSVLSLYSDDPSSNPAGYLINFLYEKTKINEKEAGVGPSFFKKKKTSKTNDYFFGIFI